MDSSTSDDIFRFISNYVDDIREHHYTLYKTSVETEDSGDAKADRNAAWARGASTMGSEIQALIIAHRNK